MDSINVNGAAYWLPETNDDVISLVNEASTQKKKICVRGAAHSFPLIGTLEAEAASGKNIYIMLSKMYAVSIDKPNMMVTVQAGCHLGYDPFDPLGISSWENSLTYQLNQQGMAIGDLGGISHQTVGGFLSTGSSGGTTQYSFEDALMSIDVITCGIDGAELVNYSRPEPDDPSDPFYAVGLASMGLMGVIVSATFKCIPNFNITGSETTTTCNDCQIDLFGPGNNGKPSFQQFLEQTEYTRIIWWPQAHVGKSVVWQAKRIDPEPGFVPKPYQEVPWVDGSPVPATLGADVLYSAMGTWPTWLGTITGTNSKAYRDIKFLVEASFKPLLFPAICDVFVSDGVKTFWDYWYTGLPMDDQMGDKIMPVWFTELWIPIDQSQAVMNAMKTFYDSETGCENTGIFCVEIYAAKQSSFWLSPAYNTNVIRIDIFWFANSNGDPAAYYQKFWDLLQPFKFRPHWGKYLPDGNSAQGVSYLKSVYPKWNDWMSVRSQNDPGAVFLNDYWNAHLGIQAPVQGSAVTAMFTNRITSAMISPDQNGLYHPANEQEIIDLINYAVHNKLQVRVRGAAQSVQAAVYTDDFDPTSGKGAKNINIELDQLRSVDFDTANMQVTVGGGCNLGWDPFDPSDTSKKDNTNNLLYQLNEKGWALQNVPDAIHQTVAGYISTGSQAGSLMHSFDDCIVSIRVIDGTGTAKTFTKSSNINDPFYAVGVSMGLLGIITSVTLQCVPAFNIIGQEKTTPQNDCDFDFLGSGNNTLPSLQQYISNTEFARLLWWPFPTLQRMISWKAATMQPADYNPATTGAANNFKPKPYQPVFPKMFGTTLPSQVVAGTGFRIIANYPEWLKELLGHTKDEAAAEAAIDAVAPYLYPFMIDLYFPCSSDKNPPQQFWDHWNGSLPMDTIEFSDNLMDLVYTEMWIPLADAGKAINVMNDFYVKQGMSLTSYYTIEILAGKASNFWMSPAYSQDVIRLNIMRFDTNTNTDITYYQQFWDLMKQNNINFRLHWGKFLPPPSSGEGAAYITSQYPKMKDFLSLRSQMDPGNIFLTNYWKSQLGISV